MGPAPAAEQERIVAASPLQKEYGVAVNRNSAYERLAAKTEKAARAADEADREEYADEVEARRSPSRQRTGRDDESRRAPARSSRSRTAEKTTVDRVLGSSASRSVVRSASSTLGREITRGLFGVGPRR